MNIENVGRPTRRGDRLVFVPGPKAIDLGFEETDCGIYGEAASEHRAAEMAKAVRLKNRERKAQRAIERENPPD